MLRIGWLLIGLGLGMLLAPLAMGQWSFTPPADGPTKPPGASAAWCKGCGGGEPCPIDEEDSKRYQRKHRWSGTDPDTGKRKVCYELLDLEAYPQCMVRFQCESPQT